MKTCANPTCSVEFEPKTVSNKYCSAECRSETTNNNLKKTYWRKKNIKSGALQRKCEVCNITTLSRYNVGDVCEPCQNQPDADARTTLLKQLGALT